MLRKNELNDIIYLTTNNMKVSDKLWKIIQMQKILKS